MDEIECKKKIMRENKICFSKNLIRFIQIFKEFIDYVYKKEKKECVCEKIHLSLCTCNKVRNINDETVHFLHNSGLRYDGVCVYIGVYLIIFFISSSSTRRLSVMVSKQNDDPNVYLRQNARYMYYLTMKN